RHTDGGTPAHLGAAAVVAAVGTFVLLRFSPPRTVLRLLALSPTVVAVLWLATGPVHEVAFAEVPGTVQGASVEDAAPIVMIVLGELATAPLLDADGGVSATLYPGFSRLAPDSTWYRNTTSVSPTTPQAVRAILTGQYPGDL